jgi:hypothetical protein
MGTLKSLVQIKEAHQRMMAEGRLTNYAPVRKVEAPQKLVRTWQDGRQKNLLPQLANPTDPTPERVLKASEGIDGVLMGKGERVGQRQYRVRHPVDSYKDHFDFANQRALESMIADSEYATRVNVTANYEREGIRTTPGTRMGGLGDVADALRMAHARFYWVYDRLPSGLQATLKALVLQERTNDGTVLSMEGFGARLFPEIKDRATRKGISLGALWALSEQLVQLRRVCPFRNTDEPEAVKNSDVSRKAIAGGTR